jgi:hypothetical protein
MPRMLTGLGFAPARARWLSEHIIVDPSRGAGHALQALRRGDFAAAAHAGRKGGMDYKGYNIAVHELGHNVEQVFSLETSTTRCWHGGAEQRVHGGAGVRLPGAGPRAAGLKKPDAASERSGC